MAKRSGFVALVFLILSGLVVAGCGSGGSTSTNDSGAGPGTMLYSCTQAAAGFCTQLIIPSSGSTLSTEQATCANEGGTSGTGCSTVGIAGCCLPKAGDASKEEQCFYDADQISIDMLECTSGHAWSTTMS
jgi:hypothetical protein